MEYTGIEIGGRKKLCIPMGVAMAFVPLFEFMAKVTRTSPLFTRYALYTISTKVHFTHGKATAELGYSPRLPEKTIADTVNYLIGENIHLD